MEGRVDFRDIDGGIGVFWHLPDPIGIISPTKDAGWVYTPLIRAFSYPEWFLQDLHERIALLNISPTAQGGVNANDAPR